MVANGLISDEPWGPARRTKSLGMGTFTLNARYFSGLFGVARCRGRRRDIWAARPPQIHPHEQSRRSRAASDSTCLGANRHQRFAVLLTPPDNSVRPRAVDRLAQPDDLPRLGAGIRSPSLRQGPQGLRIVDPAGGVSTRRTLALDVGQPRLIFWAFSTSSHRSGGDARGVSRDRRVPCHAWNIHDRLDARQGRGQILQLSGNGPRPSLVPEPSAACEVCRRGCRVGGGGEPFMADLITATLLIWRGVAAELCGRRAGPATHPESVRRPVGRRVDA